MIFKAETKSVRAEQLTMVDNSLSDLEKELKLTGGLFIKKKYMLKNMGKSVINTGKNGEFILNLNVATLSMDCPSETRHFRIHMTEGTTNNKQGSCRACGTAVHVEV